ncbi:hypothetical protein FB451DRAFT_308073 [Mycena latifolia]|nr:hypothetical protein FB451DRAFT_308073 [Mycena latifolia]
MLRCCPHIPRFRPHSSAWFLILRALSLHSIARCRLLPFPTPASPHCIASAARVSTFFRSCSLRRSLASRYIHLPRSLHLSPFFYPRIHSPFSFPFPCFATHTPIFPFLPFSVLAFAWLNIWRGESQKRASNPRQKPAGL